MATSVSELLYPRYFA